MSLASLIELGKKFGRELTDTAHKEACAIWQALVGKDASTAKETFYAAAETSRAEKVAEDKRAAAEAAAKEKERRLKYAEESKPAPVADEGDEEDTPDWKKNKKARRKAGGGA